MRLRAVLLLALLAALAAVGCADEASVVPADEAGVARQPQRVYRDDFEQEPWARGWQPPRPPATEWARGVGHSGSHSLKLTVQPGEKVSWTRRCALPVKRNVKYRLSVWIKLCNVSDHYGARFWVNLPGGEGTGLGWLCGNDGWRQYSRYFTPRRSDIISSLGVSLAANNDLQAGYELGEMTAYFDDLTVEETNLDLSTVPWDAKLDRAVEVRAYSNQGFREVRDRFKQAVAAGNGGWIQVELERGNRQLTEEQFYPDGGQIEASPHYHMVTMRSAMAMVELARAKSIPLPEGFTQTLPGKITDFFVLTLTPQLRIPLVGDNGGDHIDDVRTMTNLFHRPDTRWVWTGRKEGAPPRVNSVAFPDTGFYVMRSGWEPDAQYLLFRCLDHHGFAVNHFHRDQLSFLLYAYGQPMILERGGWGDEYKRTEYHNTLALDGHQQNLLEATCRAWVSTDDVDFVDGSHPGYLNATCRRRIFFLKSRQGSEPYWVMSDLVVGSGRRSVKQFLHFDPAVELSPRAGGGGFYAANRLGWAHLAPAPPGRGNTFLAQVPAEQTPRAGLAVLLGDHAGRPLSWQEEPGRLFIVEEGSDARSPRTFDLPAPVATWSYAGALPQGAHLVLVPFKDQGHRPEDLQAEALSVTAEGGEEARGYADGMRVSRGAIRDLFCFATEPQRRRYEEVVCDGLAGFLRLRDGEPERVCLVQGRTLSRGEFSLTCSAPASVSVVREGARWVLLPGTPPLPGDLRITVRRGAQRWELP